MPWWSWIVIWIALVALSLLFFVVLGAGLFRKFMTTVRELGDAAERFSRFPSAQAGSNPAGPADGSFHHTDAAVFASPVRVRNDYRAAKIVRQEARRLRRVQRKAERGQPQSLRDIDFS